MDDSLGTSSRARLGVRFAVMAALSATFGFMLSCDALSPSFLSAVGLPTVGPSSSGHVVVVFRNDTKFDAELVQFLRDIGVADELLDDPDLRPLVRFVVQITFVNGQRLDVEFQDGSTKVIDPRFDPTTFPDLTRDQLRNLVVQCDVARVEVIETTLEIFVPVFFKTFRDETEEGLAGEFRRILVNTLQPHFQVLQRDDVDQRGNVVLQRNLDIRDVPAPAEPLCGSVVALTLSGALRVPFIDPAEAREPTDPAGAVPGVLQIDLAAVAETPGRFQMLVSLR
ncbi:MAG: hypothetical protein IID39_06405 [Planctomycetes bacterium]|nr:hypothetical protein [Planctomycetota bacterium]